MNLVAVSALCSMMAGLESIVKKNREFYKKYTMDIYNSYVFWNHKW